MLIAETNVIVTCPGRNYVLVRVETNDGIVGWGDATLNGREKAVEAALEHHVFPEISGRDPRRIEDIWQLLFRNTYWRGGGVLNSALSGVDMALWDIKGKIAGQPVYELLGGRTRDYVTVYDHCGGSSVGEIVENSKEALDGGFDHFRVNLRSAPDQYVDVREMVDAVLAVREELGPAPELLVDVHGRADPIQAARVAKRLEPADPFFLEDPLRPENPEGFELVRRHATTPLAMGEVFTNPWEMTALVNRRLVDFVRASLTHIGGITAARKLATVAEQQYVRTAFQGPRDVTPIGLAATVHVDMSVPNFGIQEWPEHQIHADIMPELDDVFSGGASLIDGAGAVDLPEEPGLGVDVDVDAAREYEYQRRHLPRPRNPDGSVQDW